MRNRVIMCSLAVVLLMTGCRSEVAVQTVPEVEKVLVKVAPSTVAEVEQLVEFTGTILPNQQNTICPSGNMRIDEILVDVGDNVKKGQLLVKMDPTSYRQTAVQLAQLEADYQRMKVVYDAKGISKQQLDAQKMQVDVTKESADNLLTNTELHSPITGVVTNRLYDPGDMFTMSPKDNVIGMLTIMEIDKLKVDIEVSEAYFPQVKIGMPVDLKLDIMQGVDFNGKISRITPAIDPTTRTFGVQISLPNSSLKLRPGMFTRVFLNFGKVKHVLIPDMALQKQIGTNERFVYILEPNSTVRREAVTVGRQLGNRYEILSGVKDGETLVVAGVSRLKDGALVSVSDK